MGPLLLGVAMAATPAEELARLRADVDALSTNLMVAKEEAGGRLRAIEAQTVDVQVQLRREALRLERLAIEEVSSEQTLASQGQADPAVIAAVRDGLASLRDEVARSLPFKRTARLASLAALQQKLDEGLLPAEQVAARLWAFAEDERRLAQQNAIDRQVAPIDDDEVLVDVARVGMVALYWRAQDGRVGRASPRGDLGTWIEVTGSDAGRIEDLFDALDKGIRVGWFELPGLLEEASP